MLDKETCWDTDAGFRLTCRLPHCRFDDDDIHCRFDDDDIHCRFDDDIRSTAQESLAAEG